MGLKLRHIEERLAQPRTDLPEHEYQAVCQELEPLFGKAVWTLPFKKGVTEHRLREAAEIARKRGILKFNYLVGILKRLP